MKLQQFNPTVRFCSTIWLHSEYQKVAKAYDFRLFYVISGGFTVYFADGSMKINKGGVLILPPCTGYRLAPNECKKSNHIIVNFDFVNTDPKGTPLTVFEPMPFDMKSVRSTECIAPFSQILQMENAFFCHEMLQRMCDEVKDDQPYSDCITSGILKQILSMIAREASNPKRKKPNAAERLCAEVTEYLKTAELDSISNGSVARKFGYHPYYLNSVFKQTTGLTLHALITKRRLELAKELLLSSENSIAEISRLCGFSGASYFSECFKDHIGITPGEYRQNAK